MTIRTRFAPSPTGYLHIGGVRTALYSWLYAKHHGGQYILRIEDTDRERSTAEATDVILQGMAWLGLNSDAGPYYQTQRMDRYNEVMQQLLDSGHAYRCRCSKARLDAVRAEQTATKQKPRYDGHCRDLALSDDGSDSVIRFKNPVAGEVQFNDQVLGTITISNQELDDFVIRRSDGMPTYNFAVVVDDSDMQITHVIRGNDHINNTPRQINLFQALGITPPLYAHIPMILGDDGKRLSKRHGAVSVLQYREGGFLPQALLNYLVRLGWSHGDQEIFSLQEMIDYFDFSALNRSAATFNPEKLLWLNQHYIKTLPVTEIATHLAWMMDLLGIDVNQGPSLTALINVQRDRVKTLREMAEQSRFLYQDDVTYNDAAAQKHLTADILPALQHFLAAVQQLEHWEPAQLQQLVTDTREQFGLKMPKFAQPLRVAMTGDTVSPSIDITLSLLGKERVCARLERALQYVG